MEPALHSWRREGHRGAATLHAVHDVWRRGDDEPHPTAALAALLDLQERLAEALALRVHEALQPLALPHRAGRPQARRLLAVRPQRVLYLSPTSLKNG